MSNAWVTCLTQGDNSCLLYTSGTVAGAIYGFVVVWIVFYVIALCGTSEVGGALISYIYESPFLTYIYENNLIVALIMMFL